MAKLENTFKKYLIRVMGTRWDIQSHEDKHSTGIPDLSFGIAGINGWIELKQISARGAKLGDLVKPKEFTPEQVNWLSRRHKKGGNCYVMVRVGKDEYFILSAADARKIANGLTMEQYYSLSIHFWIGHINPEVLTSCLSENRQGGYWVGRDS